MIQYNFVFSDVSYVLASAEVSTEIENRKESCTCKRAWGICL